MKKVVAGLLCLSMIGALGACGKKDSDDTKKTKASKETTADVSEEETEKETEATTSDEETSEAETSDSESETTPAETSAAEGETIWEMKDIDIVGTFPEHKAEEITGDQNNTLKMASAKICNPKDETLAALKSNEWLSSLGTKADIKGEWGHSSNSSISSCSWYYTYDDGLAIFPSDIEAAKMYGADLFAVDYHYATRETIGERSVTVEFNNLDMTDKANQEHVFEVVKQVYGEDFGEKILFAKDPDPDKYAKHPDDLSIHETIDGVNINVTRNLNKDSMHILVSLNAEGCKNNGGGITQGHTPDFSAFKGLPDNVFGGNTGNQTPNDTAFLDTLRSLSDFTDSDSYTIEYKFLAYKTEDGKEHDSVEIKYEKTIDCSIWFEYQCAFDGDTLTKFSLSKGIMQSVDHGRDADTNLKIINETLTALFGQEITVQTSDLNDQGYGKITIDKQLGDQNRTISIEVKNDGQAWWSIAGKLYLS